MHCFVVSRSLRVVLGIGVTALAAVGIAGCSSDTTRFADNPLASPYASSGDQGAGALAPARSHPVARIDSQSLPPAQHVGALPAPTSKVVAAQKSSPANPAAGDGVHVIASGETLSSVAHHYGKSLAVLEKANNLTSDSKLRVGQQLVIPGTAPAEARAVAAVKPAAPQMISHNAAIPEPASKTAAGTAPAPQRVASLEPTVTAQVVTPSAQPVEEQPAGATNAAAGAAKPTFRWPVRGRIIAGFGPKTNGQQNDGINLSVPEGTSIKAADDGVVAYAGNELKGYGNLVLIRHPSGYVTAYAHASELLVKRGDPVNRGDVIARSGQTGNVSAPQLHFEIRKGSAPVDPTLYLAGL